jgi:5-methyltetrahydrofolate--homocysteine methyltransferase
MEGLRSVLQGKDVILLDGAMGTELSRHGVQSVANANLSNPETVKEIHNEYLDAGSSAIITNTLTMNRIYIESHHIDIDVGAINRAGASLAVSSAAGKGFVLGNLSSTGQMLEPYGTYTEADFIAAFKEQASCLQNGQVDGFIIETVFDLHEAICALKGCKAASSLPVIVCIAFNSEQNGGRTMMGDSAKDCALRLTNEGADAIGANCGGIDPRQLAEIIANLSVSTRLPLVAEPNAGKPRLINGVTSFDMDPTIFALGMLECNKAGARILGGCCGTTPDHIRALKKALGK